MKIIITESQFKRLIENIISESDSKKQEFIDILNKENIPYEIKDNKIIIGGEYFGSDLITYIPDNVEFNNSGHVNLYSINKIGNNIQFNNKGYVWLDNLKEMGNNIKFNNNSYVSLNSIIWFNINSVNFTNNVGDVYFGKQLFWMEYFPHELYNIKGKFHIWDEKKDEYEIIK